MPRNPQGVLAATACVVDGGWGTYRQFHSDLRLLRRTPVGDEVIVYPPDENRRALDLFRDQGFEELRLIPRMRLGKPLTLERLRRPGTR